MAVVVVVAVAAEIADTKSETIAVDPPSASWVGEILQMKPIHLPNLRYNFVSFP